MGMISQISSTLVLVILYSWREMMKLPTSKKTRPSCHFVLAQRFFPVHLVFWLIWYISAGDNHIFVICLVDVICEVELNTINGNNVYSELSSSSVYFKILHPNINQHYSVVVCLSSLVRFGSWILFHLKLYISGIPRLPFFALEI